METVWRLIQFPYILHSITVSISYTILHTGSNPVQLYNPRPNFMWMILDWNLGNGSSALLVTLLTLLTVGIYILILIMTYFFRWPYWLIGLSWLWVTWKTVYTLRVFDVTTQTRYALLKCSREQFFLLYKPRQNKILPHTSTMSPESTKQPHNNSFIYRRILV